MPSTQPSWLEIPGTGPTSLAPAGLETAEVHRLVRRLVDQLAGSPPPRHAPGEDDILLDLVVDGFRCVVLRHADEPVTAGMPLSPRETEIARMVAKGLPNKTIAAVLEISSWTVSTHLRRMFAKLGVTSRAAMVARLLEPRPPTSG